MNNTASSPSNGKVTLGSWRCGPAAEVHDKGVTATGTPSASVSAGATHAPRGFAADVAGARAMAAQKESEKASKAKAKSTATHAARDEMAVDASATHAARGLVEELAAKMAAKKYSEGEPRPTESAHVPRVRTSR